MYDDNDGNAFERTERIPLTRCAVESASLQPVTGYQFSITIDLERAPRLLQRFYHKARTNIFSRICITRLGAPAQLWTIVRSCL